MFYVYLKGTCGQVENGKVKTMIFISTVSFSFVYIESALGLQSKMLGPY